MRSLLEHGSGQCWCCSVIVWGDSLQCDWNTIPSNWHFCGSPAAGSNTGPSPKEGFDPESYYKSVLHSPLQVLEIYLIH
jgi:hypothetical protein